MARKATATQATQVGAGDMQAQLDALAAQNRSLMETVASMGAQLSAQADAPVTRKGKTVELYSPVGMKANRTDKQEAKALALYGDGQVDNVFDDGGAGLNIAVDLDAQGFLNVRIDTARVYGLTKAKKPENAGLKCFGAPAYAAIRMQRVIDGKLRQVTYYPGAVVYEPEHKREHVTYTEHK